MQHTLGDFTQPSATTVPPNHLLDLAGQPNTVSIGGHHWMTESQVRKYSELVNRLQSSLQFRGLYIDKKE